MIEDEELRNTELNSVLCEFESGTSRLRQLLHENRECGMLEHATAAVNQIEKLFQHPAPIIGIPTGFPDLEKITGGFGPGELIVIASRPMRGKTAFALNIVEHVTITLNKPMAFFCMSMTARQLTQRLLCMLAKADLNKYYEGTIDKGDMGKLINTALKLSKCKMLIDDTADWSVVDLCAKAREMKARDDIQLIVIDWLQLLSKTSPLAQKEGHQIEIAEICRDLKSLAVELRIPILALAQLNRNSLEGLGLDTPYHVYQQTNELPDCSSMESHADVVGLLCRKKYPGDEDESKSDATLMIVKNNNGPTRRIPLTFLNNIGCFERPPVHT